MECLLSSEHLMEENSLASLGRVHPTKQRGKQIDPTSNKSLKCRSWPKHLSNPPEPAKMIYYSGE